MDDEVARSINVWLEGAAPGPNVTEYRDREEAPPGRGRPNFTKPGWRWRLGGRGRGR
jgi:hypothetical protein